MPSDYQPRLSGIAAGQAEYLNQRGMPTAAQYSNDINAMLSDPNSAMMQAINRMRGIRSTGPSSDELDYDLNNQPGAEGPMGGDIDADIARMIWGTDVNQSPVEGAGVGMDDEGSTYGENAGFMAGRVASKGLEQLGYRAAARAVDAERAAISATNTAASRAFSAGASEASVNNVVNAMNAQKAAAANASKALKGGALTAAAGGVARNYDQFARVGEGIGGLFYGDSRYFPTLNNVQGLTRNEIEQNRNNLIWQGAQRGMAGMGNMFGDAAQIAARMGTGAMSGLTFGGSDALLASLLPEGAIDYAGIDRDPLGAGRFMEDLFTQGRGRPEYVAPSPGIRAPGRGFSGSQSYMNFNR